MASEIRKYHRFLSRSKTKRVKSPTFHRKPFFEVLEPRILLSTDLSVLDVHPGEHYVGPNQELTVDFRAGNLGDLASPVCQFGVVLSQDSIIDNTDTLFAQKTVEPLEPGQTRQESLAATLPPDLILGQAYRLGVIADYDGQVAETDEANNTLLSPEIQAAIGADSLDFSGVAANLTITVAADGSLAITDGSNVLAGITGVKSITGGTGNNTIISPDSGAIWTITGENAGSVNGISFANFQNLAGGAGDDAFVFSGGSVAGVVGGAGIDTLDLSADSAGVTVDLRTGTATCAGSIVSLERVMTGAGDDTIIGALAAVSLDTGAGTDTLDFSAVTADLTVTVAADGSLTVTDGSNIIAGITGVEVIAGGTGNNTIIGPDSGATWTITGFNSGTLNGISFTNFQNLAGGAGPNGFVFTGGRVSSVTGNSGIDTLDLSADTEGVALDLNARTATHAGTISQIENIFTGAGDDTFVGALIGVIINPGSGVDTLDFSDLTVDLTATIGADGTVAVTDGTRIVSAASIENIIGSSGLNTYIFEDGASLAGMLSGVGAVMLDYASFTAPVTVNLASGSATGTGGARNVKRVKGGKGGNTLVGPNTSNIWNITGPDAGEVAGVVFADIEDLMGAPGNQDTFIFAAAGSMSGQIDGGIGGFDSLVLDGSYTKAIFSASGPDSGTVDLDGSRIRYAGLEPITLVGTVTDVVVDGSSVDDALVVDLDGTNIRVRTTTGTIESVSFAAPTGSLTINGDAGTDSVTVAANLSLPGADLAINTESITVNSGVTISTDNGAGSYGDVTFTASASDTITTLLDPSATPIAQITVTDATITGGSITMTSTATTSVAVIGSDLVSEFTFELAIAKPSALVSIDGASSVTSHADDDSTGDVTLSAVADVTGSVVANSLTTGSTNLDVTAAVTVVDSSAVAMVLGTTVIDADGALEILAANTSDVTTTADGTAGGITAVGAGAALAFIDGTSKPISPVAGR